MNQEKLNAVYAPSEDVVAREIEDEFIIVPLTAGIGDMEDALYSLNDTGRALWKMLDGEKDLKQVVDLLAKEFDSTAQEVEPDVLGFVEELLKRGMLVVRES